MKLDAKFTSQFFTDQDEFFARLRELPTDGVGYWRLLDQKTANAFPETTLPDSPGAVPFYEAQLYFEGRLSVSVRQLDNGWLFNTVEWHGVPPIKNQPDDEFLCYTLLAKIGGKEKTMCFCREYHEESEDSFMTLKPGWNAFIGFAKEEE